MWEGTLKGEGTAFKPKITVTLNEKAEHKDGSKWVVGNTTVSGDSNIYMSIVVDEIEDNIRSVVLDGVSTNEADYTPSGSTYEDRTNADSDTEDDTTQSDSEEDNTGEGA